MIRAIIEFRRIFHDWKALLLIAFLPLPAYSQSEYQGTYTGYSYVRLEGAITQPETPNGIAIAEVDIDGNISVQNGAVTGTVDSAGTITWDQPNDLFLNAGNIADGTLHATGSSVGAGVTTFTRLELKTGGGFDSAASLDDYLQLINPQNILEGKIRVIHDGTRFVALGEKGFVSTSEDGVEWQTKSIGITTNLRDFAYGNGTYMAVGEANTILTSTDLVTWTPRSSGIGDIQNWTIHSAAFFNGRFYIVNTIGAVARSSDASGAAWEAPLIVGNASTGLGSTSMLRVLNNRLYLSGKRQHSNGAEIFFSTDGTTFTPGSFSPATGTFSILNLAYGNGKYALNLNGEVATSTDGVTFTRAPAPIFFAYLGFDGERFVGRAAGSSNVPFRYSDDASTWTAGAVNSLRGVVDIASHNGKRIAVGSEAKSSTDGLAWSAIASSAIAPELLGSDNNNLKAVYGNGLYILHGKSVNYITRNGTTWTTAPAKSPIVFANGIFLSGNEISTDGVNWTPTDFGFEDFESVAKIASDGVTLLVISTAGRVRTSTDGVNWTFINPSSPAPVNGHTVVGANGQWFSLATGGAYSRSLDGGVTWTNHTLSNATLNAMAFGNGRWILAAQNNRFYVSSNGSTFTQAHANISATSGDFTSVSFLDGKFFVYYEGQGTYYTGDGLSSNWDVKSYSFPTRLTSNAVGPDFALLTGGSHFVIRVARNEVGQPLITSQPQQETTLDQDETFTLQAAAIGTGELRYQWFRNGFPLTNGGRVSGADSPSLQLTMLRGSDAGHYSLVVSNDLGSDVTETSFLDVRLKSQILSQPQSVAVLPGTNATFTVGASPDTTGIQWLFNGNIIPNANSETLLVENVSAANAGLYSAVLTNEVGDITTPPASLSLLAFAEGYLYDSAFAGNLPEFSGILSGTSGASVSRILPLPDGKFYVAGQFAYQNGADTRHSIVRLNADGSLDPAFVPPQITFLVAGNPRPFAIQDAAMDSLGRVTVVFANPVTSVDGVAVQNLGAGFPTSLKVARFSADGSLDLPYVAGTFFETNIRAVAIDSQDRLIFGGNVLFGTNTSTRRHVVRVLPDGQHDTSFASLHSQISVTEIRPRGITVNPDDTVLAVGQDIGTSTHFVVKKLATTGGLAPGFNTAFFSAPIFSNSLPISAFSLDDGGMIVTGLFASASNSPTVSSPAAGIARFAANGTRVAELNTDSVFENFTHRAVLPLPGGTMFVGGTHQLTGIEPPSHNLTELDENWQPILHTGLGVLTSPASAPVESLARSADGGSIYAGHHFGTATGFEHALVSRIGISSGALPGAPALAIVSQTPDTFAEPGDPVLLTVAAVGANVSFQWLKNGKEIAGATTSSLSFPAVTPGDAAQYRVRISDVSGNVTGLPITLTVPGAVEQATFASWADELPEDQRGFDADPAGDGVANGFKFLLDLDPTIPAVVDLEVSHPSGDQKQDAAAILAADPDADVEEGKTYWLVSYRLPADMKGLSFGVQPTEDLLFGNGDAAANPLGDPVPDGDFLIHSYYITPATEDAPKMFWRLELSE